MLVLPQKKRGECWSGKEMISILQLIHSPEECFHILENMNGEKRFYDMRLENFLKLGSGRTLGLIAITNVMAEKGVRFVVKGTPLIDDAKEEFKPLIENDQQEVQK